MIKKLKELREAIRNHRDQKGDDRCWVDDHAVYNTIPSIRQKIHLLTFDEGMKKCRLFYQNRNAPYPDSIPADAIRNPDRWDDDLARMNTEELRNEYARLEQAIVKHHTVPYHQKTIDHDRELYGILPEKIPADFRLPSEEDFLGTKRTDAGCPQFWKSHLDCPGEHNIHQWGPCKK